MNEIISSLISIENKRLFSNQFDIELIDSNTIKNNYLKFSIEKYTFNENNSVSVTYEESIFLPHIERGKYPQTLSITVREYGNFEILKYMNNWYSTVFNRQKNCFKKGIRNAIKTLNIYYAEFNDPDPEKNRKLLYSVRVLPKDVPMISGDYTNAKPITYNLNFFILSFEELQTGEYSWL